jgi:hypothetical protein
MEPYLFIVDFKVRGAEDQLLVWVALLGVKEILKRPCDEPIGALVALRLTPVCANSGPTQNHTHYHGLLMYSCGSPNGGLRT